MAADSGEQRRTPAHLPECCRVPFAELAEDWPDGLPDDMDSDFAERYGLMSCAPGCPHRAAAVAHGRELAERFGW